MTGFPLPTDSVGEGTLGGVAMPFKDHTDFPDIELFPPARGGPGGAQERPPAVRPSAPGARPAPPTGHQQKPSRVTPGKNRALALAVGDLNSTLSSVQKLRANDSLIPSHKALVDPRRGSRAISEAVAMQRAQAATPVPVKRAKAIAADRRMFNPTPGPKTLFGTQATVKPTVASRFRFAFPAISYPCVVRKTRKEVLFALRRAGGSGSRKPKKIGPYSYIGC